MAATPAYWSDRRMGRAVLSAATTDKTGATVTNIVDILTGVAAGTEITEINVKADGDPADCVILIFVHNGTDYRLYDEIDIANPAAGSATTVAYGPEFRYYTGLFLPSASWKLAAAITAVPTAGTVVVWAAGGDLT
jgi:hypothetical protein